MQTGVRLRFFPSSTAQVMLWQWIGAQEFIYNAKTSEDRYFRTFARKALTLAGQYPPVDQAYSQFNATDIAWIRGTPSQILRNGAVKWYEAYRRFFKKLGGRPRFKKRHGKRSVWLTSELFRFPGLTPGDIAPGEYHIEIGTKKKPVATMVFYAHVPFRLPKSLHISIEYGQWHLSFSYDDETVEPSDQETAAWLRQRTQEELGRMTVAFDRGVAAPVVGSDGSRYGYTDLQLQRMARKEQGKKRWQRRMARRQKGSKRYANAKARAHKAQKYAVNVRRDFAHQTSHRMTADDQTRLIVLEALKLHNMTASANGTKDAPGKHVRQKAGLNRSLLHVALGQIATYIAYKARRRGKLLLKVSPQHSSQECASCGHVHPGNRPSRARFVCLCCGHVDDADYNASIVLKKRGIAHLFSEAPVSKPVKSCGITKKKQPNMVGAGCSEPAEKNPPTLVETGIRRTRKPSCPGAQQSKKRETSAITCTV
jgi:putative transposase